MGLPLLMALLAAGGVLLIVWALLGTRSSDPVQARLTQLGTLEGVTSLEEIELQQPLMDRTLRPMMRRLSGIGTKAGGPDYLLQFVLPRTITENTMRRASPPACNTRCSSPPETISKPEPRRASRFSTARLELALTA